MEDGKETSKSQKAPSSAGKEKQSHEAKKRPKEDNGLEARALEWSNLKPSHMVQMCVLRRFAQALPVAKREKSATPKGEQKDATQISSKEAPMILWWLQVILY